MKAEIKIPKGWRRLRRGEKIQKGDKFDTLPGLAFHGCWDTVKHSIGSMPIEWRYLVFIRRIKTAKPSKSKYPAKKGAFNG